MDHGLIDMTGKICGNLKVLRREPSRKRAMWRCRCTCGNIYIASGSNLRSGTTNNYGCLTSTKISESQIIHGHSIKKNGRSKTYSCWKDMLYRCLNPDYSRWDDYGGRGITVVKRWLRFENFLEDMGEAPSGLTLERKDNNAGYSKNNCCWATYSRQNRNKRHRRR